MTKPNDQSRMDRIVSLAKRRGFIFQSSEIYARQEIRALSERWLELAAQQGDLQASAYMLILDDGRFAAMQAERPMAAASSIKTPILLAVLELLDQGTLQWNEPLLLTEGLLG